MSTLYETSIKSRKFALIILLIILAVLIVDTAFSFKAEKPIAGDAARFYMPVNRVFDEVPVPKIPSLEYNPKTNFVIESVHGEFPDVAYVYKIEEPREKLLSFENALDNIASLGFNQNESEDLGDNDFKWIKDNGTKTLIYNRLLQSWKLDTAFYQNEDALQRKTLLKNIESYIGRAKSFINSMNFDVLGMEDAKVDIRYAKLGIDGIFLDVANASEGEYVFLNIFKKLPLANLKPENERPIVQEGQKTPSNVYAYVYSEDPRKGQLNMIASNSFQDYSKDLFQMDFTKYEYSQTGSYYIITPDEAWNKVQNGQGSLTFIQPQNSNYFGEYKDLEITRFIADARRTELAYWEPKDYVGYTFPIYIFKGRAELSDGRIASFMFYVDAIKRVN